jgi:hypothetical protein
MRIELEPQHKFLCNPCTPLFEPRVPSEVGLGTEPEVAGFAAFPGFAYVSPIFAVEKKQLTGSFVPNVERGKLWHRYAPKFPPSGLWKVE